MRVKNKKTIFIGGFSYGQNIVDETCKNLSKKYGDVKGFTFIDAMHNRRVIARQVNGAHVIVHSAGIMALKNTSPNSVIIYGGPLGNGNILRIIFKSIFKFFQMIFVHGLPKTINLHKSYLKEQFLSGKSKEEKGLFRYFISGEINKCDSVAISKELIENGCKKVQLIYGEKDLYFKPAQKDLERISKINKLKLKSIPGAVHDEILLNDDLSYLWD